MRTNVLYNIHLLQMVPKPSTYPPKISWWVNQPYLMWMRDDAGRPAVAEKFLPALE